MPVPDAESSSETKPNIDDIEQCENTDNNNPNVANGDGDDLVQTPVPPIAPPNSARTVTSRTRLLNLAPKPAAIRDSSPAKVVIDSVESNGTVNVHKGDGVATDDTPDPKYTATFFQLAKSKEIVHSERNSHVSRSTTDIRASENNLDFGANILNYKPGYLRSPSPKRVQFFEGYYKKAKLTIPDEIKETNEKHDKLELKSISSAQSKKSSKSADSNRLKLNPSTCEAVHLVDLRQKYGHLNKSLSKSAQILSVAPRPVAGFPSKPLKAGSFMLSRRKGQEEFRNQRGNVSLSTNAVSKKPGVSIYSFDDISKSVDANINNNAANHKTTPKLPSVEDWKDSNSSNSLVDNASKKEVNGVIIDEEVPFNSCKTSVLGSDILMAPESQLATRGTMRPWSGTCSISVGGYDDESEDIGSEVTRTDIPITQKPLISEPLTPFIECITPGTNISANAFRPSKSVHMLNYSQAHASYHIKNKISEGKKNNAIIMDIYKTKKAGKEPPALTASKLDQLNQQQNQALFVTRKNKTRSRSLGRVEHSHQEHVHSKQCVCTKCASGLLVRETGRTANSHLLLLANRGGRNVLFTSRHGYHREESIDDPPLTSPQSTKSSKYTQSVKSPKHTLENKVEVESNAKSLLNTEVDKPASILKTSSSPTENVRNKTSSIPTESVRNKAQNMHVNSMFSASHYSGFQHAKFSKNKSNNAKNLSKSNSIGKDKPATYNEDLKAKFLKVSVGGDGFNGFPSDSYGESPRSFATSEFTLP